MSRYRHPLDAFFKPRAVAVIGASEREGSLGRTAMQNLMHTPFGGLIIPVNPKYKSVLGIRAYSSVREVPEPVDLAIIATPAPTVPEIVRECAAAGVQGVIIVSAGFVEKGEEGAALEREILAAAREGQLRVLGPSSLGVICPRTGLNASVARHMPAPGQVAFITQSAALGAAILDWSVQERVGFSAFVSLGGMLDIACGDLIEYLGHDPYTKSFLVYTETVGNARAFLSAAREVALDKPIIVLRPGRTPESLAAIEASAGRPVERDDVFQAALRRVGVLRANTIAELFYMAEVLSRQPRPPGPHLAILTNAGGPGALAADALLTNGGRLAPLAEETVRSLNEWLPAFGSHHNPVDISGEATPEQYERALDLLLQDPHVDGVLVIYAPQVTPQAVEVAERVRTVAAKSRRKPVLASWMGGAEAAPAVALLNQAGIPTFPYPDTAARVFTAMWRYSHNLRALYETPVPADADLDATVQSRVQEKLDNVRAAGRTALTEEETLEVLQAYGIWREPPALIASPCYQLAVGSNIDSQFGPVLFFGVGGELAEIFPDYTLALPPLNTTLARRMMERTRIYQALQKRNMDLSRLEQLLVRFSRLVVEQPWLREAKLDLLLSGVGDIYVKQASLTLHDPTTPPDRLPRPAIRPYPVEYTWFVTAKDGTPVTIRPIRPDDEPLLVKFHHTLSDESVYMRFFHLIALSQRISHERLSRLCFVDYDREIALVAEHETETGEREILGVVRLRRSHFRPEEGEFAVLVSDKAQGKGLGTELMRRLLEVGQREGLARIYGEILPENVPMQRICRKLGFELQYDQEAGVVTATISLRPHSASRAEPADLTK